MWENINGEWIFMDKEMGTDEYERSVAESNRIRNAGRVYVDAGRGLGAGGVCAPIFCDEFLPHLNDICDVLHRQ